MPRPLLILIATACLAAGCGGGSPRNAAGTATADGLRMPARVHDTAIQAFQDGAWRTRFWAGVNLGSTTPGHDPGEVAATRADYDRWLTGIGALGARVVRVYTILRPSFYDALRAYDLGHPDAPLYLIQGVWIPEEQFLATRNLYAPAVTRGFEHEIGDAVAVVHGDARLPQLPGHAGGVYRSDVSPWLLAWSPGVEWDPVATAATDRRNARVPHFQGRYVTTTRDATPTESWIAHMLDHLAGLEAARGWSRPLTFTNWLTTDPLHHPYEPLPTEDMVSVDAAHLRATSRWPGGFFASYHVYPYYPDFLSLTPAYRHGDPYAAFLQTLRAHHRQQAVMVTEFGVPTGPGIAHLGPDGRSQGGHTETQAGRMDAAMLADIHRKGFAGGVLFEWMDEWFKFSWNTWDTELPADRRQLWVNAYTNEEHFGVVAADPVRPTAAQYQVIAEARGEVRQVAVAHDPEYLYLRLRLQSPDAWRAAPVSVGFDVRPGGNRGLPGLPGTDAAADVALTVGPGDTAQVHLAAWDDPMKFMYGPNHGYVPYSAAAMRPGSGVWDSPALMLDRPYRVPVTGRLHPTETADIGRLGVGSFTEPTHLARMSGNTILVRLPWALLTFSDPSSLRVWMPHTDGTIGTLRVGRVGIDVAAGGRVLATRGYAWDPWNAVRWHERRKAGWDAIRRAMLAAGAASAG